MTSVSICFWNFNFTIIAHKPPLMAGGGKLMGGM